MHISMYIRIFCSCRCNNGDLLKGGTRYGASECYITGIHSYCL